MPTSTPLSEVLEDFVLRLMNMSECDSMDALVDRDLSFSQARTLFVLARNGEPTPINVIAESVSLSMAAAGRNVDQLVQLELVERRESPEDRRVKLISLTSAGEMFVAQHLEAKRGSIREFVANLPHEQGERLHSVLSEILAGSHLGPAPTTHSRKTASPTPPSDKKVDA